MSEFEKTLIQIILASLPSLILIFWQKNKLKSETKLNESNSTLSVATAAEKLSDTAIDWVSKMEQKVRLLEKELELQQKTIDEYEESRKNRLLQMELMTKEIKELQDQNRKLKEIISNYEKALKEREEKIENLEKRIKILEKEAKEAQQVIRQLFEEENKNV